MEKEVTNMTKLRLKRRLMQFLLTVLQGITYFGERREEYLAWSTIDLSKKSDL